MEAAPASPVSNPSSRPSTTAQTTPLSSQSSSPALLENLTASQRETWTEFKALCEKNELEWTWSTEGKPVGADIEDEITMRFLRARHYHPQAALKQYSDTIAWRKAQDLDKTYDEFEVADFEVMSGLLPRWTGRRDKNGIPVFNYVVSAIRPDDLVKTAKIDPELRSIFLPAEYATGFVIPVCEKIRGKGAMVTTVNIIDLSGVGVTHFWKLRHHLQKSSAMATAHYPESVERIFIVGAPAFFPTIWGYIQKWFDPATTSKILVLSHSEVKSTMEKYIDIENIPKRYGGELDWDYHMDPILDDGAKEVLGDMSTKWIEGPLRYLVKDEKEVVLAVGSIDGKPRRDAVNNTTVAN